MLLRFEATMNGKKFSRIAEECILVDIVEDAADMAVDTAAQAGRDGMRVLSRYRKSLSVTLSFVIRTQDIRKRAEIMRKVAEWAGTGGKLEINPRPGKYLYVVVDTPPAIGSHLKWTEELQLTLTAYSNPYWISQKSYTLEAKVTGGGSTLNPEYACSGFGSIGGDLESDVSVTFTTDTVSTLPADSISITCGNTSIAFEGTGVSYPQYCIYSIGRSPKDEKFDAFGMCMLLIAMGDHEGPFSLLPYRTAESDDELKGSYSGGDCSYEIKANNKWTSGTITFYERWL